MRLLLILLLLGFSFFGFSQADLKYYSIEKLNAEKSSAVSKQDYKLAATIKEEIDKRNADAEKLKQSKLQINEAVNKEKFALADSLKKEILRLESLERNRKVWSLGTSPNKRIQEDSINFLLGNSLSKSSRIQTDNTTKTNSSIVTQPTAQKKTHIPKSNLNTIDNYMDKQNLNYVGLSLRFSEYGFFLEGGTLRWKLAKQLYGGEYIGLMFTSEQIITSFGLEATYMFDYGAQFVPYASTAAFMTVFSYEEYVASKGETETKWDAGVGGFIKGGFMLFFKKQKSSAFYANIAVGYTGGIDYRMGVYLAINKKK
jgi:hypothetical protein